jgi:hypothetical protein
MQPDQLSVLQSLLQTSLTSFLRGQEAYLDPGSGSYLLQLLIASFLGGLFALRASWGRIKSFFQKRSSSEEEESLSDDE